MATHADPVVEEVNVDLFIVKRILVYQGCSADVLYKHAFDQHKISKDRLKPVKTPLIDFSREVVYLKGEITVPVIIGEAPRYTLVNVTFIVVDMPSPYNVILLQPCLNIFGTMA
ncbi:hypothetical protein CFOL_v3_12862 [Cephalotus follicularis]|uniref:Uncharacterized protein n=1 Tax=Cephalotus follicularis TaxID=3775 RepID=A0A1Q3BMV8_CEPFO|nr:hypothetical protein CFOL_v3_12862 [Cephalotus follicularis]